MENVYTETLQKLHYDTHICLTYFQFVLYTYKTLFKVSYKSKALVGFDILQYPTSRNHARIGGFYCKLIDINKH